MSDKEIYYSLANSGNEWVDWIFDKSVYLLNRLSDLTGITYWEINVLIFVILQPGLILLFFILWRIEKNKNK
jgi:hypothetical protein